MITIVALLSVVICFDHTHVTYKFTYLVKIRILSLSLVDRKAGAALLVRRLISLRVADVS